MLLALDPYRQVNKEIKRIKIKKNKINLIELKSTLKSHGKKKTEKIRGEKNEEEGRAKTGWISVILC
jgi:hypothetical protein